MGSYRERFAELTDEEILQWGRDIGGDFFGFKIEDGGHSRLLSNLTHCKRRKHNGPR